MECDVGWLCNYKSTKLDQLCKYANYVHKSLPKSTSCKWYMPFCWLHTKVARTRNKVKVC